MADVSFGPIIFHDGFIGVARRGLAGLVLLCLKAYRNTDKVWIILTILYGNDVVL